VLIIHCFIQGSSKMILSLSDWEYLSNFR